MSSYVMLVVGLFIGGCAGVLLAALMAMARRQDE
jgi:ABC-type nitrate/sulfonate/bicarbonate transport system permease component